MGSVADLKRVAVERLLDQEDSFLIVVDPRAPRVILPPNLIEDARPVGLSIGHKLAIPIPDLAVDEEGITATLSFDRTPFHCTLPWQAIMQISVNKEHLIWVTPRHTEARTPTRRDRPTLRLVK